MGKGKTGIGIIAGAMATIAGAVSALSGGNMSVAATPNDENESGWGIAPASKVAYSTAVAKTAAMATDSKAQNLAHKHGLNIVNLTWEDTGRYKGSSVGPNISDMTIQVAEGQGRTMKVTCMPVIRYPNFSDKTGDMDPRDFTLLVGNEDAGRKGQKLQRVSLHDFLEHPTRYLTHPEKWKGPTKSLLAPARDIKVLVSAQACFLPVPKSGKATFNPVLFNYQSYEKNPAVLTILATREGTSVTVIDNKRDAFATGAVWGQRLFFNSHGERTSLTGERLSDFKAKGGDATNPAPDADRPGANLNMVLLIQVPLKYKEQPRRMYGVGGAGATADMAAAPAPMARSRAQSNVESAVIGHGEVEGPFTETDNLTTERDPRFPVRVTVQFYKATDNGVVSPEDITSIKDQIQMVYDQADNVGSLVTEGNTGRITEYDGAKVQPADWWQRFWERYEKNTGVNREEAVRKLQQLLGVNYQTRPVTELYLRHQLRPLSKKAKNG